MSTVFILLPPVIALCVAVYLNRDPLGWVALYARHTVAARLRKRTHRHTGKQVSHDLWAQHLAYGLTDRRHEKVERSG